VFYQNDISEFCSLLRNYCLVFPLHIPHLVLQQLGKNTLADDEEQNMYWPTDRE
jgi:hypothetical protein